MSSLRRTSNTAASDIGGELLVLRPVSVPGAAASLSDADREALIRRYFTLIVPTGATTLQGGAGHVAKVYNTAGEAFALKQPIYAQRDCFDSDADWERNCRGARVAFEAEFKNQAALSRLKGLPQTYGYGLDDRGEPYIIMEWIDGVTINDAMPLLAHLIGDTHLRRDPLTVARMGMALYDLVDLFSGLKEGFIHRDISPRNIMFRTTDAGVDAQIARGTYDFCLIDFGSGIKPDAVNDPSLTTVNRIRRGATPEYAPPEMLSAEMKNLEQARKSPKIDVYAIAGVLYEMMAGHTPYQLGKKNVTEGYFRYKMDHFDEVDPTPAGTHSSLVSTQLLQGQPELETLMARLSAEPDFDDRRAREALCTADAELGRILMRGLQLDQATRADARTMKNLLTQFAENYVANVERAYRGQELVTAIGAAGPTVSPAPTTGVSPQPMVGQPAAGQPSAGQRTAVPPLRANGYDTPAMRNAHSGHTATNPLSEATRTNASRSPLAKLAWLAPLAFSCVIALVGAVLLGGNEGILPFGGSGATAVPSWAVFVALVLPSAVALPAYALPRHPAVSWGAGTALLLVGQLVVWSIIRSTTWANLAVEPVATMAIALITALFVLLVGIMPRKD